MTENRKIHGYLARKRTANPDEIIKSSFQTKASTIKRLQCYLVLKGQNINFQSAIVERALNHFLDSEGFPTWEALHKLGVKEDEVN